jgi:Ni,Fe-hydrogenase I cytochrome b subunit
MNREPKKVIQGTIIKTIAWILFFLSFIFFVIVINSKNEGDSLEDLIQNIAMLFMIRATVIMFLTGFILLFFGNHLELLSIIEYNTRFNYDIYVEINKLKEIITEAEKIKIKKIEKNNQIE